MRDVRGENDDNYATRDTNCPRVVSLSMEARVSSLCLPLFLSASFPGENNRETRRWPVSFMDTRDETRLPLLPAIY